MQVIYRHEKTIDLCKDKTVLNLGFVQHHHWRTRYEKGDWLHEKIKEVAKEMVGIDYLENSVHEINEYFSEENVVGDVCKLEGVDLDKKFDVVNCGELIEHLENPGQMLLGIKRFMDSGSRLIITTPNAFREEWVKRAWRGEEGKRFLNKEHVCWYSYHTLRQLLERCGYSEVDYGYYYSNSVKKTKYRPVITEIKNGLKRCVPNTHPIPAWPVEKQMGLYFVASID